MEIMEENKKPKVMIVGHVDHGNTTLTAAKMLAETHDVSIITPEQAREMGDVEGITLPFHAPAPIPILEEPLTIIPRNDYTHLPKSGREARKERRKKKSKRNRRY